jgi:hypothetical protein
MYQRTAVATIAIATQAHLSVMEIDTLMATICFFIGLTRQSAEALKWSHPCAAVSPYRAAPVTVRKTV